MGICEKRASSSASIWRRHQNRTAKNMETVRLPLDMFNSAQENSEMGGQKMRTHSLRGSESVKNRKAALK